MLGQCHNLKQILPRSVAQKIVVANHPVLARHCLNTVCAFGIPLFFNQQDILKGTFFYKAQGLKKMKISSVLLFRYTYAICTLILPSSKLSWISVLFQNPFYALQPLAKPPWVHKIRVHIVGVKTVRTTLMSSCFPSKFCISRRQTLNESLFGSSVHIRDASYSFPVLKCSAVTRTTGVSLNLFCVSLRTPSD